LQLRRVERALVEHQRNGAKGGQRSVHVQLRWKLGGEDRLDVAAFFLPARFARIPQRNLDFELVLKRPGGKIGVLVLFRVCESLPFVLGVEERFRARPIRVQLCFAADSAQRSV
jgi:hypothetical protein